jgi:hypothetical protein
VELSEERKAQFRRELEPNYADLGAEAVRRCRRRRWIRGKEMPGGLEPEDVLHRAIDLVYSGRRPWPESMDLRACLIMVMRSIIDHAAESAANTELSLDDPEAIVVQKRVDLPDGGHEVHHPFWTRERDDAIWDAARDAARDHPAASAVLEAIEGGAEKAGEAIEDTGLSDRQVYGGIRYLKKHLTPLVKRWR